MRLLVFVVPNGVVVEPVFLGLAAGAWAVLWENGLVIPFLEDFAGVFVEKNADVFNGAGIEIEGEGKDVAVFHLELVVMITAAWNDVFFEDLAAEVHFIETGGEVRHLYETFGADEDVAVLDALNIEREVFGAVPAQVALVVVADWPGTHGSGEEYEVIAHVFCGGCRWRWILARLPSEDRW